MPLRYRCTPHTPEFTSIQDGILSITFVYPTQAIEIFGNVLRHVVHATNLQTYLQKINAF